VGGGGWGVWGWGSGPTPQSPIPIPNPQSPNIYIKNYDNLIIIIIINKIIIHLTKCFNFIIY